MYNGIGLTTPRGSGTSGHITRNLSHLRPRDEFRAPSDIRDLPVQHRQPDAGILDHERKRKVEVACLELQDDLEEKGIPPAEVEEQVEALRQRLLKNSASAPPRQAERGSIKEYQRHELLAAKAVDNAKMERALGIRKDYVEGDSMNKEKQELLRVQRQQEREERQAELAERKRQYELDMEQRKREQEDRAKQLGTAGGSDTATLQRRGHSGDAGGRGQDFRDSYRPARGASDRRSRSPVSGRRDRSRSRGNRNSSRSPSRSASPPSRRRRDASSPPRRGRARSTSRSASPPSRRRRPRSYSSASSGSRSSRSRSSSRERAPARYSTSRRSRSRSPVPRSRPDAAGGTTAARSPLPPKRSERDASPEGSDDMDVESGAGSP